MKTAEQLAKLDNLIELMTQYYKLAVKNKAHLSANQKARVKKSQEDFLSAKQARKKLSESLKKEETAEQMDPQTKKFMEEAQKMLDTFETEMKSIQEAIKDTVNEGIKGGKALLSKI